LKTIPWRGASAGVRVRSPLRRSGEDGWLKFWCTEGDSVPTRGGSSEPDVADLDVRALIAEAELTAATAARDEANRGDHVNKTLKRPRSGTSTRRFNWHRLNQGLLRQDQLSQRSGGHGQETRDARSFAVDEFTGGRLAATTARFDELAEARESKHGRCRRSESSRFAHARQQIEVQRDDSRIGHVRRRDPRCAFDEGGNRRTRINGFPNSRIRPGCTPISALPRIDPVHGVWGSVPLRTEFLGLDFRAIEHTGGPAQEKCKARIVRMQPQIDPTTRTRGVELELDRTRNAPPIHADNRHAWVPWSGRGLPPRTVHANSRWTLGGLFGVPTESLYGGVRGLWFGLTWRRRRSKRKRRYVEIADWVSCKSFSGVEIQVETHPLAVVVLVHGMLKPDEWNRRRRETARIGPPAWP